MALDEKVNKSEDDLLLDHDYDGIRELDNSLPPWWLNLFYVTIIWGFGYLAYYHVLGIGDLSDAEYQKEMNPNWVRAGETTGTVGYHSPYYSAGGDVTQRTAAEGGSGESPAAAVKEEPAEEVKYELLTDAASLANGEKIYMTNCFACHGQGGGGTIGPNLTDDYWVNCDGTFSGIINVIRDGVPIKGMIPWKNYLKPQQVLEVGSFIYGLHGTSPPTPKKAEGKLYERK